DLRIIAVILVDRGHIRLRWFHQLDHKRQINTSHNRACRYCHGPAIGLEGHARPLPRESDDPAANSGNYSFTGGSMGGLRVREHRAYRRQSTPRKVCKYPRVVSGPLGFSILYATAWYES